LRQITKKKRLSGAFSFSSITLSTVKYLIDPHWIGPYQLSVEMTAVSQFHFFNLIPLACPSHRACHQSCKA
ncbi:MAG: hypothetical protein RSD05_10515, partial [Comamonas sp.]